MKKRRRSVEMKSRTFNGWDMTTKKAPEGYKIAFAKEEPYLLENVPKDSIVLDVGCGNGRILRLLASQVKKIIGIDNDSNAIERSKEALKDSQNVEIYSEDAFEERMKLYNRVKVSIKEIKGTTVIFEEGFGGENISEQFSKEELEEIFNKVGLNIIEIKKIGMGYVCKLSK